LPQQIRRMNGEPAARLGLCDRGLIREGFAADLVLLDMERMIDASSLACPDAPGGGMDLVMVNGEIAYRAGVATGALAGRLLKPRNG
jgi:N-acyl-D-amino-acid deacylase